MLFSSEVPAMMGTWVKYTLLYFLLHAAASAKNPSTGKATMSIGRICLTQVLIEARASDTTAQVAAAKSKAEQVRDALRSGGSWADLTRTNPTGVFPLQVRGLGCLQRGELIPPIGAMRVGDVSDVLNTKLGFAVLRVWGEDPQSDSKTQQPVLESGVQGRVVGTVEHIPISNAYVVVHRDGALDAHVRTDGTGRFAMPLPVGIYDVFISADGFSPTSRKIQVMPDSVMTYDAALEFNTLEMEFDGKVP